MSDSATNREIEVIYSSSRNEGRKLSIPLHSLSAAPSTNAKTEYLAALRSSTTQMQAQINHFLTQKMAEDSTNTLRQDSARKEEQEEENYGEEAE